jgi:hypothetical protein
MRRRGVRPHDFTHHILILIEFHVCDFWARHTLRELKLIANQRVADGEFRSALTGWKKPRHS